MVLGGRLLWDPRRKGKARWRVFHGSTMVGVLLGFADRRDRKFDTLDREHPGALVAVDGALVGFVVWGHRSTASIVACVADDDVAENGASEGFCEAGKEGYVLVVGQNEEVMDLATVEDVSFDVHEIVANADADAAKIVRVEKPEDGVWFEGPTAAFGEKCFLFWRGICFPKEEG